MEVGCLEGVLAGGGFGWRVFWGVLAGWGRLAVEGGLARRLGGLGGGRGCWLEAWGLEGCWVEVGWLEGGGVGWRV